MKKDKNILKTVSYLAMQLEDSKTYLLNAIAPGTLAEQEKREYRRGRYVDDDENDENNPYSEKTITEVVNQNAYLSNYLGVTSLQSALFVAAFSKNFNKDHFDADDVSRFFELNNMQFMVLAENFDYLVKNKYIVQVANHRHFSNNRNYKINPIVKEAIMCGKAFDKSKLGAEEIHRYKFVKMVSDLIDSRSSEDAPTRLLFEKVAEMETEYPELTFVKNVCKMFSESEDRTLFYEICDDFLSCHNRMSGLECTLNDIYDNYRMRFAIGKMLKDQQHLLQKAGLVEISSGNMFSEASLSLTDKGKRLFLEEDYDLFTDEAEARNKSLVYPDKIPEKQMFYDADLTKQLELFTQNLDDDKFSELQQRLEKMSLPKGITALFHGLPGTGKTETAMQIARATGRAVCHVDISAAKTCWYGESQKLVKRIFTNYRSMCEKEERKPILLFNEADALFSSRQNVNNSTNSSVAQTENAIQNIILEEMENLDGILIATTNLTDNLDSAFARRFLFKVQFNQPTVEAKQSIWKSKLEWLSDDECRQLAQHHDFSGGEIDNIVRKVVMEEVLHGKRPDIDAIEDMCRHEKLGGSKRKKIGFNCQS